MKTCKFCGGGIPNGLTKCPDCGADVTASVEKPVLGKKWYQQPGWIYTLVFLFFPVGLYQLWKSNEIKKRTKYLVTLAFGVILIIGAVMPDQQHSVGTTLGNDESSAKIAVEMYLKYHYLKDPSSYESVSWGNYQKTGDSECKITHTYKAKNGFGALDEETRTFEISDGQVTTSY